jgi:hypothetical protein
MSYEDIESGCVIRYPYLWTREANRGETEGRKERPTAVGFRLIRSNADDSLVLFPITSRAPRPEDLAVEIPEIEKRRAGLDAALRLWVILDEYNTDVVGQSFHLEPSPPLGRFSKAFFLPLMREFVRRRSEIRGVERWR